MRDREVFLVVQAVTGLGSGTEAVSFTVTQAETRNNDDAGLGALIRSRIEEALQRDKERT